MGKSKKSPPSPPEDSLYWRTAFFLLKEFGMTNLIIIFYIFAMIWFSNSEQKTQFVDNYILFKSENHYYCFIVITGVTIISIIGANYYRQMLRITKVENERIGQEKSDLHELLLNNPGLASSKKNK